MKKIYTVILLVFIVTIDVQAQQDPHYTQYMYNMNIVNPAYAGSKENMSFGLLYRKQWINIDGSPSTFTFSGSSAIGNNLGIGLSMISDKIGPVSEQNVYTDLSYTLNLGGEHRLAFGLKVGGTFHSIGLNSAIATSLPFPNDDAFKQDTNNFAFNAGTGLFYYTDKYYISFSVPNMIKSTYLDYNGVKYGTTVKHYFLTGGYVFDLNANLKFKPFMMIKSAFNVPVSLDVSSNFLINDKFEIGATYRLNDSFGAIVSFAIRPELRVGYAYDHVVSNLNITTPSSHEIILLYDLTLSKKVSRSPRYF